MFIKVLAVSCILILAGLFVCHHSVPNVNTNTVTVK